MEKSDLEKLESKIQNEKDWLNKWHNRYSRNFFTRLFYKSEIFSIEEKIKAYCTVEGLICSIKRGE